VLLHVGGRWVAEDGGGHVDYVCPNCTACDDIRLALDGTVTDDNGSAAIHYDLATSSWHTRSGVTSFGLTWPSAPVGEDGCVAGTEDVPYGYDFRCAGSPGTFIAGVNGHSAYVTRRDARGLRRLQHPPRHRHLRRVDRHRRHDAHVPGLRRGLGDVLDQGVPRDGDPAQPGRGRDPGPLDDGDVRDRAGGGSGERLLLPVPDPDLGPDAVVDRAGRLDRLDDAHLRLVRRRLPVGLALRRADQRVHDQVQAPVQRRHRRTEVEHYLTGDCSGSPISIAANDYTTLADFACKPFHLHWTTGSGLGGGPTDVLIDS
jgi:hypothetical protein